MNLSILKFLMKIKREKMISNNENDKKLSFRLQIAMTVSNSVTRTVKIIISEVIILITFSVNTCINQFRDINFTTATHA